MDDDEQDLSWLTQDSYSQEYWKPETATFVRYVYDDDEYVDPVGNEVVIRQHLPDNYCVRFQEIQNGLIDNFDTENPPVVSLHSSVNACSQFSEQQTQRFSEPVTEDDLSTMQRKT